MWWTGENSCCDSLYILACSALHRSERSGHCCLSWGVINLTKYYANWLSQQISRRVEIPLIGVWIKHHWLPTVQLRHAVEGFVSHIKGYVRLFSASAVFLYEACAVWTGALWMVLISYLMSKSHHEFAVTENTHPTLTSVILAYHVFVL